MRPGWKSRAATWLILAESARANRAAFPTLPTTWLPHSVGNTLLLWMPELVAALDRALGLDALCDREPSLGACYRALDTLCVNNPGWAWYVAPSALGYALSHPRFNIYRGEMGEMELFGFGLDAIPHSVTAFAITLLFQDGIQTLAATLPEEAPLTPLVRALARRPALFSGLFLALLSAVWEAGEWSMQQDELRRTGGDASAINMQWDLRDTLTDLVANGAGWLAATRYRTRHAASGTAPQLASQ